MFGNGYSSMSPRRDALYVRSSSQVCIPDGTSTGTCRKWFGRCKVDATGEAVKFRVFDNGDSRQSVPRDAVYFRAPNQACIPDSTSTGSCRRWTGLATTQSGKAVRCRLFDDGYRNMTGPTHAIYFRKNGQVCMPDGTATGTCRKWLGRCEVAG